MPSGEYSKPGLGGGKGGRLGLQRRVWPGMGRPSDRVGETREAVGEMVLAGLQIGPARKLGLGAGSFLLHC